jgi:type IV fimbrial biogenesis protein FimT
MNRTERTIQPTPRNPQIKGTATHTRRRSMGFTLIELMVTLTVAVILIAIAIPSFNYLTVSSKLTTVSNGLVTALNTARMEAIKRNNLVTVCSNTGNGADTLGTACGTQAGAVYATLPNANATLVSAGIVGITPPISIQNFIRLNFSGQGLGETVGSNAPYTGRVADIYTNQISSNNHRCVYITTGSVVRTCTVTSTGACPNAQPNPCNQ